MLGLSLPYSPTALLPWFFNDPNIIFKNCAVGGSVRLTDQLYVCLIECK